MRLPFLSLALLLQLSSAAKTACPVAVAKCPTDEKYHILVNNTIREVLADFNKTSEAYEFFHDYEARLHTFILDLRVALLTDQRLLERLLYLQKTHGDNFTSRSEFNKECDDYNVTRPLPDVTCPEVLTECPTNVFHHLRVNQTIKEVLADINKTTETLHEFMGDYELRMHTFIVDLRVAMLKDERLLERLALLQKLHGSALYWHPVFAEWCSMSNVTCSAITDLPCPETVVIPGGNTTTVTPPPSDPTTTTPVTDITPSSTKSSTPTSTSTTASTPTTTSSTTTTTATSPTTTVSTTPTTTTTTRTTTTSMPTTTTTFKLTPSWEQYNEYCYRLLNETVCENCESTLFSAANENKTSVEFLCEEGTSFFENKRELHCIVEYKGKSPSASVHYANRTEYKGKLQCTNYVEIPKTPEQVKRCKATCDKSATCKLYKDEEVICTCPVGTSDISANYKKPRGAVCAKCKNLRDIDFVIVYDKSGSITGHKHRAFNFFLDDLINFLDADGGDNRLALVSFATGSVVRVNLTSSANDGAIRKFLADPVRREDNPEGAETNTALGLHMANREIYAKLPANSTRHRITILLTDGEPSQCNHNRAFDRVIIAPELNKNIGEITVPRCKMAEMKAASKEMREKHHADIFVVLVGEIKKHEMDYIKAVQKDPTKIMHAEKFGELRTQVTAKLQKKIC